MTRATSPGVRFPQNFEAPPAMLDLRATRHMADWRQGSRSAERPPVLQEHLSTLAPDTDVEPVCPVARVPSRLTTIPTRWIQTGPRGQHCILLLLRACWPNPPEMHACTNSLLQLHTLLITARRRCWLPREVIARWCHWQGLCRRWLCWRRRRRYRWCAGRCAGCRRRLSLRVLWRCRHWRLWLPIWDARLPAQSLMRLLGLIGRAWVGILINVRRTRQGCGDIDCSLCPQICDPEHQGGEADPTSDERCCEDKPHRRIEGRGNEGHQLACTLGTVAWLPQASTQDHVTVSGANLPRWNSMSMAKDMRVRHWHRVADTMTSLPRRCSTW